MDEFSRSKQAVMDSPDDPMAHVLFGYYFHKVGKTVDAIAQYKIAMHCRLIIHLYYIISR